MLYKEEIQNILSNFTSTEVRYIQQLIQEDAKGISKREDNHAFIKIIRSIDSDSTQATKDLFIELLEDIFLSNIGGCLKLVDEGSNWSLTIKKRSDDDWDTYILLARDASDDSALTDDTQTGQTYENAKEETISFEDYAGTAGTFQKVRVLLENETDGTANGDAVEQLLVIWVYVKDDIDSD